MTEEDPILRKVRNNIALSQSDSENEARNAAVIACRLILDHKLEIVRPEEIQWARGMLTAYEGCVMLAREEYDRLLAQIEATMTGKRRPAPVRSRLAKRVTRKVEDSVAEAAGNAVTGILRGAFRRL